MALINCKECGKEISDTVKECPHCGYKNKKEYKSLEINEKIKVLVIIVMLGLLCFFLIKYGIRFLDTANYYSKLSASEFKSRFIIDGLVGVAFVIGAVTCIVFDVKLVKKRYKELIDIRKEDIGKIILCIIVLIIFIIIAVIVEKQLYIRYCSYRVKETHEKMQNTEKYYDSVIDSVKSNEFCAESGCTNKRASGSIYCYTHKPSTSNYDSTLPYCKYSGCYNRVPYSWREYCDKHSYMEY